jgi:hypothetical protein
MALASDEMTRGTAEATAQVLENKQAEEEAAKAARQRQVDEAKAAKAKKDLQADAAILDKADQKRLEQVATDQKQTEDERKRFEADLEGLGRKKQGIFDPRGDMTGRELQAEQAGRVLNTKSDMNIRRAERDATRKQRRLDLIADQASDTLRRGGRVSRRGRMALDMRQREFDIKQAQDNIDQRKKQAEDAQIKTAEIQREMKSRQEDIFNTINAQITTMDEQIKIQARIEKNTAFLQTAVSLDGGE